MAQHASFDRPFPRSAEQHQQWLRACRQLATREAQADTKDPAAAVDFLLWMTRDLKD